MCVLPLPEAFSADSERDYMKMADMCVALCPGISIIPWELTCGGRFGKGVLGYFAVIIRY